MSKTIYNADYSECLPEALKKDPKMVALANATAAALRVKESVMGTVTSVQENAADILAAAKDINERRAAQEEIVEDTSTEATEA